ncbi:acyltransferase [Maricaulis sp.]|uniref:acyltransferase family protein n=1 Tax=Maricaulis sp. TaxID=1486257 RepID=UPI002B2673C8|nr:acyltransferase [Maricaulis sp.]
MGRFLFRDGHGHLDDKANNFTAMRIAFALIVLYGHALMIPLGLPFTGAWAVFVDFVVQCSLDGFFILSGYMITASAMKSRQLGRYASARVFRIFPGLIATVLLLWLVVGPLFTTLPATEYWAQSQTWLFPLKLISQADPMAGLPGVFDASPMGAHMNGPLWTIRYELMAYVGVGLLMLVGLYRQNAQVLLWTALTLAFGMVVETFGYSGIGEETIGTLARFAPAFMVGAAFHAGRKFVRLTPAFAGLAVIAALLTQHLPIGWMMVDIALASIYLLIGYARIPGQTGVRVRNVEDISYGLYILHWPVGMMVFALLPGLSTTALALIMLPLALLAGWALRVLVEKPALALKSRLAARTGKPVAPAPSGLDPERVGGV